MEDKELIKLKQDYLAYYEKHLRLNYEILEDDRKSYLGSFISRLIVLGILLTLYIYFLISYIPLFQDFIYTNLGGIFFVFGNLMLLAICYYLLSSPFNDIKQLSKENLMVKMTNFFPFLNYGVGSLRKSHIQKSMLFDTFSQMNIDDIFSGTYNDTDLCIAECELFKKINYTPDYNTHEAFFRGLLVKFDLSKELNGITTVVKKTFQLPKIPLKPIFFLIILPIISDVSFYLSKSVYDMDFYKVFGFICFFSFLVYVYFCFASFFSYCANYDLKKPVQKDVSLEDIVFDKHWTITSTDQIEARYILTPAIIDRMVKIKNIFPGKKIKFSFYNQSAIIAIPLDYDAFETVSLFSPATNLDRHYDFITLIYQILRLIDELKLKK